MKKTKDKSDKRLLSDEELEILISSIDVEDDATRWNKPGTLSYMIDNMTKDELKDWIENIKKKEI